jgi:hypothetical protein
MAHFAEIDSNNLVLRVIVVDNNDVLDSENNESEAVGITYLEDGFGGNWVQTSYNRNFRKNYAATGYTYDSTRNAFIPPQRFASWNLNEDTCIWESPVAHPDDDKMYEWDEDIINWIEITE